jgi:hypothetical protein
MLGGEATLRRSHPAGFTVGSGAARPRDNSFAQNGCGYGRMAGAGTLVSSRESRWLDDGAATSR